jgi:Putative adhesin
MFPGLKPVMMAIALSGIVMPATRGIAKGYWSVPGQERRVERGGRIVVRNQFGDIRIAGSDRNTVEAIATELNSSQSVPVSITEASSGNKKVFTVSPVESGRGVGQKVDILLEVKVPHDVELAPIYIRRGNISVIDLDGGVSLRTDDGNISVRRVGSRGGGIVEATTGSGNVDLSNINGDVRIVAISSGITVQCVKGDVAARVSSGEITVSNIDGDVELNVSSGSASFTGPIHPERRYRLKTLSGNVSMDIPDSVGFTAVLSAYSGQLETDFQFSNDSQTPPGRTNRRVVGKYGDGSGRVELDSFSGHVRLRKKVASSGTDCQR